MRKLYKVELIGTGSKALVGTMHVWDTDMVKARLQVEEILNKNNINDLPCNVKAGRVEHVQLKETKIF